MCAGDFVRPAEDRTGFRYNASDFEHFLPFHREHEVQVLHFHSWTAFWSNISSIGNGKLLFQSPTKTPVGQWATQGGQRYLLENVLEGLGDPGDWYWDQGTGKVLLIPPPELAASQAIYVVAPRLLTLVEIGSAARVTLEDIELHHADTGDRVDQYYTPQAALKIYDSTDLVFNRVAVRHSGGAGIMFQKGSRRIQLLNSAVLGIGASGIEFQDGIDCSDVLVNNSLVNDTARIILGQPGGIRVKGQKNMTVSHNTVAFTPYAGIMIGWQSITSMTPSDIIFDIAHNEVHDYGLGILSDFGGIYLSSSDNLCFQKSLCHLPTRIHHNHIHNCRRFNYGCEGVYMDEQVSIHGAFFCLRCDHLTVFLS